jgi:hybrid cluster-associated redox disulfide protein
MADPLYTPNLTAAEVLQRNRPHVAAVFIAHKTDCIGCTMAGFCTLEDVADVYGIPLQVFLNELEAAAQSHLKQG